nr:InlB B-repeat-containing protein [Lachnospiraceae bacterium]
MKSCMKNTGRLLTFLITFLIVTTIGFAPSDVKAAGHLGFEKGEGIALTDEDVEDIKAGYVEGEDLNAVGSKAYSSSWDIYSSNYYYNQLTSAEQAFWDEADAICLDFLTGTDSISSQGGYYYMAEGIDFTDIGRERAEQVYCLFQYSNPQYYFLDLGWGFYGTYLYPKVFADFANGSSRATATATFLSNIKSVVSAMNRSCSTDLEKIKYAHDWICDNITYNSSTYDQTAYSVLGASAQYTVCAGYSQAFQLLMNAVNIDCTVQTSIDSETNPTEGHEWNIVKLYGYWYYMDVTWDDDDYYDTEVYTYFNRSHSYILTANGGYSWTIHQAESLFDGMLPTSTADSGGSAEASAYSSYTASTKATAPTLTYASGKVKIVVPSGCTVYYSTDGVDPSETYSRAIELTATKTITAPTTGTVKAVSVRDGYLDSSVVNCTYKVYTVTLKSAGETYATYKVATGCTISKPSNPKRTGYTFGGWYKNSKCSKSYSWSTKITSNKTIYAKWTAKKYKYTFKANGSGAYIKKKGTKTYTKKFTFGKTYSGLPTAKRSGYAFLGWYTKKSGGDLITKSDTVSKAKKMTLYAHWGK